MNVFVLNAGSSSFKAAYFAQRADIVDSDEPAWSGEIRWWSDAPERSELTWRTPTESGSGHCSIGDHERAAALLFETAIEHASIAPDIIAHRVVHGLDEAEPAIVDSRVLAKILAAAELAPLHNRAALAGIDAGRAAFAEVPQAAVFDTAFHTTLPREAAAYAGPYDWFAREGYRRYGFHGISHRYCARRTATILGLNLDRISIVSAHLGNGCSLAAIAGGRSVDTTMGFTPLEGLMMGSRSGSVDPGLLLYLIRTGRASAAELERILNEESGIKGISGISEDAREVLAAAASGNDRAVFAVDLFVHRLIAGIAAMAAATNGIDVLAFTGGIGEHAAEIRNRVCTGLAFLGVAAPTADARATGDREIGPVNAAVRVVVIEAHEEVAIAIDAQHLLVRAS